MKLAIAAVALVLATSISIAARETQDPIDDFTIASWGLDDGLPSLRVWSIAEDRDGYLWLGTDDGLVRFDGVSFRRWIPVEGRPIQKGAVVKVVSARDGSIWLGQGPAGEGVSHVSNGRVENYGRAGLADAVITLLLEDRTGTIWAGNDDGLFVLREKHWTRLIPGDGAPRAAVFGGFEDSRGNLWIGTSKGILEKKQGENHFEVVDGQHQSVEGFSEDSAGRIWFTDPVDGIRVFGQDRPSIPGLAAASGNQVLHDSQGSVWVATVNRGLWRIRTDGSIRGTNRITAATRWPNDLLRSLLEDRLGNVWVAADSGLYRFTPHKTKPLTDVGRSRFIARTRDGSTFVGAAAGLVRIKGDASFWFGPEQGLIEPGVTALATDRSETLLVATARHVMRLVNGRLVPVPLGREFRLSSIRALAVRSDGSMWIYDNDEGLFESRDGTLHRFDVPAELQGRRIRCLYVDRDDRVWLSFTGGNLLIVSRDGTRQFHRVPDEHTIINTIHQDREGTVWLGGTHGLSRADHDGIVTLAQSRMPGYAVFSVIDDAEGNLWVGGALGIVRMARSEFDAAVGDVAYRPHYEMYDASDGLSGMPVWFGIPNAIENDGKLWFITSGGVTVVDPARHDLQPAPPRVQIDRVVANGRPLAVEPSMHLPAQVRNLTFEYTVPSLTAPTKVRFVHRLKDVDSGWVDTGTRREVSYANLAPGVYSFDVVAVNSDHGWNESTASWTFSIEPMFYQTRVFYALVIAGLALTAGLVWRFRVRQLRRQFSLVLAERTRMSRDIHDTLLQGMVGVALQCDMLSQTAASTSQTLADHLVTLRRQVEEYIRETREAIFDLRVPRSHGDIAKLLEDAGSRITAGSDVQFNVAVTGKARPSGTGVDRQLVQVAREAITNAVRHARARQILVKVDYRSDAILLRVSDDGRGFDVERATREQDGHFGLQTMRERVQQVGGRVRIKSSIGMGTDVEIAVPNPADI